MQEEQFIVEDLPIATTKVQFNTAILTYPSDFQGQLYTELIMRTLRTKFGEEKIVVAREDADEKIQRNHFHCYVDLEKKRKMSPKSFDIPLQHSVVVFIKEDGTRVYEDKNELESKLGWDNLNEMADLLSSYATENEFKEWKVLENAHPNLQVKKRYGSKYLMLKYVVKQIFEKEKEKGKFQINEELVYVEENEKVLKDKITTLTFEQKLKYWKVDVYDELEELLKKLYQTIKRKFKRNDASNEEMDTFTTWLQKVIIAGELDQAGIYKEILSNDLYWKIYLKNVLGFDRVILRMVKGRIIRPAIDYERYNQFYLPKKLYDYVEWLNDWVRRWTEGKEVMEDRPKGCCIIGDSRTGKTKLMTCLGQCTYIANTWNIDQWDSKAAFNVFDDMDPADSDKGLNFTWFKGFFGSQQVMDITDKYRPKRTVRNGKPLIWLSNKPLEEVFKNENDLDYIRKNCEIIYIHRPLYEPTQDWIEGHNDYTPFNVKNTWYYQNIILPEKEKNDNIEEMPLSQLKRKLSIESTTTDGRPTSNTKKIKRETSTIETM